jgi:hypothetical protein
MNRRAIERRSIASFFLRPPQERRQVGVSLNNGYNYFSENNLNLNKVELMPRSGLVLLNVFLLQAEFFRRVEHQHLHSNIRRDLC